MTTLFSDQASALATTADIAIDHERRHGINVALTSLVTSNGHPAARPIIRDFALHTMLRSVHRQARCAGINLEYRLLSHPDSAGGVNVTTSPSTTPVSVAEGRPTIAVLPAAGTCAPGDSLIGGAR
jgi:hypothetical protein